MIITGYVKKSTLNIEKNQQGNENLVNQMHEEINEVNFLLILLHKVNVLMAVHRIIITMAKLKI